MEKLCYSRTMAAAEGTLRPREKLMSHGAESLNDRELMALLLGSGCGGKDVMRLSGEIIRLLERKDFRIEPEDLKQIKGIGKAKSCLILAVHEYARRMTGDSGMKISHPETVQKILFNYAGRSSELFFTLTLNGAHELISRHIVSTGNLNRVFVQPREVFLEAIRENSAAIIIAHNHPSGSLIPSEEDKNMTRRLSEISRLLNIPLLDHIIFSRKGYYSFLEQGLLKDES